MSPATATVIVPTLGGRRLEPMLSSLADQAVAHQTIVVDNGPAAGSTALAAVCEGLDGVEIMRLPENAGYTRAVNAGVAAADGDVVVLLNDDCVCDPGFVAAISEPIDAGAGVAMSAGVMRDWADPKLIDSAGMELDRTLLVFDYLNGEPVSALDGGVADPIGPSGAAAAFDRRVFLDAGGFDERLFAYWEDVDLVLRLRRQGYRCKLAAGARGVHEHSATLVSGSPRKNYLMGFGRGFLLRKWRVLDAHRLGPVVFRDGILCAGQAVFDRNVAGVRGRIAGYRAARGEQDYPAELAELASGTGVLEDLSRRRRRRARLGARTGPAAPATEGIKSLAVFHISGTSGPSRSLEAELAWLAGEGRLDVVVPGPGPVEEVLGEVGEMIEFSYEVLTKPRRDGLVRAMRRLRHDVQEFRGLIRARRPDLVVAITSMVPAVSIAARLERVPVLVYCGELFDRGYGVGLIRGFAGRRLIALTGRLATGIAPCSQIVARQFTGSPAKVVEVVYPPIADRYAGGDGAAFRAAHEIDAGVPVIASVGYLTEGRGQDLLIRAMPEIRAARPDARVVIAGQPFPRPQDHAYRQYLVGLVAQLKLQEVVILAGHVDAVADLYAGTDVIVNPARFNEPFGRVPFEAALAGTPSVVTRVGAIPELLRDRESALIVAREDPGALAAAVIRLLADPELAERVVAGAKAVLEERLLPEHSLAAFQRSVAATLAD